MSVPLFARLVLLSPLTMPANGELDNYTDDNGTKLKPKLEAIEDDDAKIKAYSRQEAEDAPDGSDGIFGCYSDYDIWKEHIENHLK